LYIQPPVPNHGLFTSHLSMDASSPAFPLILGMMLVVFGFTGFGIYTSFGPPAKQLDDPFDEHED